MSAEKKHLRKKVRYLARKVAQEAAVTQFWANHAMDQAEKMTTVREDVSFLISLLTDEQREAWFDRGQTQRETS